MRGFMNNLIRDQVQERARSGPLEAGAGRAPRKGELDRLQS
jgi:hypothetical protein